MADILSSPKQKGLISDPKGRHIMSKLDGHHPQSLMLTVLWNPTWKPSAKTLLYPPLEFKGNKCPGKHSWPTLGR